MHPAEPRPAKPWTREGLWRPIARHHVRRGLRTVHAGRSYIANAAYLLFAVLVILLAFLPTGISTTRQTISSYALSPESSLLRVAFSCLAFGSALAAYEFWRSIPGPWGKVIAGLTGVWVTGAVIDTVVNVDPVHGHSIHGTIHAVVAVVAFSAVAGTVLAFAGWLWCRVSQHRRVVVWASVLALATVVFELSVTAASATSMAGTAERLFFFGALLWMTAARQTVARQTVVRTLLPV